MRPGTGAASVDIIIPVHDALAYTRQCLESVRCHTSQPFRIVVVDNASTDGTGDWLAARRAEGWPLVVISNSTNVGCTLALNQGISSTEAPYVILLNNDTIVCPGWIGGLLFVLGLDPRIGLVGPKILWPGKETIMATGGLTFTRSGVLLPQGRGAPRDDPRYSIPEDRQYIEGSCMLITRAVIRAIGGMDEAYAPAYYEDADYSFRAREAGFRTVYSPFSEIYHFAGITARSPSVRAALQCQSGQESLFRSRWARQFPP